MAQPKNMQSFMAFQKSLRDRGIDGQVAFVLTQMYEEMLHLGEQVDMCASLILTTVESMQGVVNLNEVTQRRMSDLANYGKEDGIEVKSVANDPSDTEH
mgnify:CR=1 FL=1